ARNWSSVVTAPTRVTFPTTPTSATAEAHSSRPPTSSPPLTASTMVGSEERFEWASTTRMT
uniref:CD45 n=1 Tax=Steinernema glaseri TaxID=37863 RepID=A0A1I7ZEJ0_9BILA